MRIKKGTTLAGVFGNALEWFDFTSYAFFATVLAKLYFPSDHPLTSLMITFSVFALGFFVRPLGAILFGYIGDHFGRRKALITSIVVMSVPTVGLGFLPTFATWGIAAPIILTLLRVMQGFAVSGELTTAAAFLVEHAHERHRGFAGSLAMCSAMVGILLSAVVAMIVTNSMSLESVESWGWRIPFWLGGLLGVAGLFVRLRTVEPEIYQQSCQDAEIKRPSAWQHIKKLPIRTVILAMCLTGIMALGNYFLIAFFVTFLTKNVGLSLNHAMIANCIGIGCLMVLTPFMGAMSDIFGRKPVLLSGLISLLLMIHPIFWILQQGTLLYAILGQVLFAFFLSPLSALVPTTLAELFDVKNRNTGLSIAYNLGQAIFGGTAPLIAVSLIAYSNNLEAPAWYFMCCTLMGLIAWYYLVESYRKVLA